MRDIKSLGQIRQGSRNYLFSVFECDACGQHVNRIKKDGEKARFCSHKCYALNRRLRGAYKSGQVLISGYLYTYTPHPRLEQIAVIQHPTDLLLSKK